MNERDSISAQHSGQRPPVTIPVDLLDYLDKAIAKEVGHERDLRKEQMDAVRLARDLIQNETDRRIEHGNKAREQIESERGTFVTLKEFNPLHRILEERMRAVETVQANLAGRYLILGALMGAAAGAMMGAVFHWK
jgi:hypothetical protein